MGILNLNSDSTLNAKEPDSPETAVNSDTVTAESTQDLPSPEPSPTSSDDPLMTLKLKPRIIEAISKVYDPEIPVNIYELGLIYEVEVTGDSAAVTMTLTSPNCPAAQSLPEEVKVKAIEVDGITEAQVEIVWEPVWGPHLMTEAARLELNL